MHLFHISDINDNIAQLSIEEARHCVQVLRKRVGDNLDLVDGQGFFYKGEIIEISRKSCLVRILSKKEQLKHNPDLKIAIAPTKNIDRLEWFLEKATEIGIDEIVPILCTRSERKRIREDRLQKILLSAMKQSLKAYLPVLHELVDFKTFIQEDHPEKQKFIAYCNDDQLLHLKNVCKKGESCLILIGPEGDFTPEEIAIAKENGFRGISLGESRLRTETAGLLSCTIFNLVNI